MVSELSKHQSGVDSSSWELRDLLPPIDWWGVQVRKKFVSCTMSFQSKSVAQRT